MATAAPISKPKTARFQPLPNTLISARMFWPAFSRFLLTIRTLAIIPLPNSLKKDAFVFQAVELPCSRWISSNYKDFAPSGVKDRRALSKK
jgi:hypothetical protein